MVEDQLIGRIVASDAVRFSPTQENMAFIDRDSKHLKTPCNLGTTNIKEK